MASVVRAGVELPVSCPSPLLDLLCPTQEKTLATGLALGLRTSPRITLAIPPHGESSQ